MNIYHFLLIASSFFLGVFATRLYQLLDMLLFPEKYELVNKVHSIIGTGIGKVLSDKGVTYKHAKDVVSDVFVDENYNEGDTEIITRYIVKQLNLLYLLK